MRLAGAASMAFAGPRSYSCQGLAAFSLSALAGRPASGRRPAMSATATPISPRPHPWDADSAMPYPATEPNGGRCCRLLPAVVMLRAVATCIACTTRM